MGDPVELIEIRDLSAHSGLLAATFDTVLRPSFTVDELPDLDYILDPGPQRESIVVVAIDDGDPVGAIVFGRTTGAPVGIVSYLASRPGLRSRGLGGSLMAKLAETLSTAGVEAVIGEVHDPRFTPETDEERPSDRIRFYERNGALALAVPWVQPSLSADAPRVRDMLLLTLQVSDRCRSEGLPAQWIVEWATDYFVEDEGAVPTDDEFRSLMDRIAEHDPIPLLDLADIGSIARL